MALQEVPREQIFERLAFENRWWLNGKIDEYERQFQRRLYFYPFQKAVMQKQVKRAVVLMGPRRVGKTVMVRQLIQSLIDKGVEPTKICYVALDTPIYGGIGLEQLFKYARLAATGKDDYEGFYAFFDEVQYLKDWEVHLKSLVDSYPGAKFVVTGSAAAALKLKSTESGAGRFSDFTLPPLTFHEYIMLTKQENLILEVDREWNGKKFTGYATNNVDRLNEEFVKYINFGGYPEVSLSSQVRSNSAQLIKTDIIDKVLLRDLPSLYGISDIQELNFLFSTIAFNTANEYTLEGLSTSSGVSKNTIKKYITYLESAFLIKIVDRVAMSGKRFQRATFFKIYLTNPSLRSALFSPISSVSNFMGNLVETAIFSQWFHRYWMQIFYWREKRGKGEVDMIGLSRGTLKPNWAVEIKWSNRYYDHPKELKSLYRFLTANKMERAVITTIDKSGTKIYNGLTYEYIPAALYAYSIGKRTFVNEE